jgi:hypothetical protein
MANHAWNGEHNWTIGEPITQEKMNSIEGGIAEAHENIANTYTKTEVNNKISTVETAVTRAQTTANEAKSAALTAQTNANDGQAALA